MEAEEIYDVEKRYCSSLLLPKPYERDGLRPLLAGAGADGRDPAVLMDTLRLQPAIQVHGELGNLEPHGMKKSHCNASQMTPVPGTVCAKQNT